MLMRAETSCLLVVDFQERLMPAIYQADQVVATAAWLIQIAQRLGIPILASEQYPKGLGPTVPAVRALLPADAFMEKIHFSCAAELESSGESICGSEPGDSGRCRGPCLRVADRVGFADEPGRKSIWWPMAYPLVHRAM